MNCQHIPISNERFIIETIDNRVPEEQAEYTIDPRSAKNDFSNQANDPQKWLMRTSASRDVSEIWSGDYSVNKYFEKVRNSVWKEEKNHDRWID